ncbi:MAG: calcium-binding protein, partial [Pseudomonadota bacterium]
MGQFSDAFEGVVSATDKAIGAVGSGSGAESATSAIQAGIALANVLVNSPLLKTLGIYSSLLDIKNDMEVLANIDMSKPGSLVDALSKMADAIAATGSLLAALPFPQLKIIGAALSITMTAVKRGLDLYNQSQNTADLTTPSENLPAITWSVWEDYLWTEPLTIETSCNRNWQTAVTPPRRDPLAIDLDGNGLQTVGIGTNPILFDHNGDGIRTGTGWLAPNDAWLVMDRDGNGSIDSGRELFGVDTQITATGTRTDGTTYTYTRGAATGFEALAAQDSNKDGVFDSRDAAWSQVKLWQDLNQDGISQATELFTLADKGIASISLNASGVTTNLGNGNTITGTATVGRVDGSTTQVDSVDLSAGNLNLADNPFYREFTDAIPLTEAAQQLPGMRGSGWVRDLREAASLESASAGNLVQQLTQFAAGTTREQQLAGLDALVQAWAATTGRLTSGSSIRAMTGTVLNETATTRTVRYTIADPGTYSNDELYPAADFKLPDTDEYYSWNYDNQVAVRALNARGIEVMQRMALLEVFNGSRFLNFTQDISLVSGAGAGTGGGGGGGGGVAMPTSGPDVRWRIWLQPVQIAAIDSAYQALKESMYAALVMQTRLSPYLDSIALVFDDTGLHFDTAPLAAKLEQYRATDEKNALVDLVELNKYALPTLQATGFDGLGVLRNWVDGLAADSPLRQTLAELDVMGADASVGTTASNIYFGNEVANTFRAGDGNDEVLGAGGVDTLQGENGNDFLDGGAGTDYVYGGNGDDVVNGGDGNDQVYGDAGNDRLTGGAGTDNLNGGTGNDTYV